MSAPKRCPLCHPEQVSDMHYARMFETYGWSCDRDMTVRSAPTVAKMLLSSCDIQMDPSDIRKHFQNHGAHRPQPRVCRRVNADNVDIVTARLSGRQRSVVDLVARVGLLNIDLIRQVMYLPYLSTPEVAQAASSREFRPLVFRHLILRAWPPPLGISGQHPHFGTNSLMMPGRNSVPFMEALYGFTPRPVVTAKALSNEELMVRITYAQDIIDLFQCPHTVTADIRGSSAQVRFMLENWHGVPSTRIRFTHHLNRKTLYARYDGIAAIGLRVPDRNIDTALPFFYFFDRPWVAAERAADKVMLHGALSLSGAIRQRLPQLNGELPPLLLIHRDPQRLVAVARELRRGARGRAPQEMPRIIQIDRSASRRDPWTNPLAYDPFTERSSTLLEALVRALPATRVNRSLRSTTRLNVVMSVVNYDPAAAGARWHVPAG